MIPPRAVPGRILPDERKTDAFPLVGGLDLQTPLLERIKGRMTSCLNYEAALDGYRRMQGFERMDGRPAPSVATYWVLNFDAGTAAITEGQTVTGFTSTATGKALMDAVVTSGSYVGLNAAGYLVLTTVSGTFQDNESLRVGGVAKSTANGVAVRAGALNDTDHNTWRQDAIETARALIQVVPGSGNILGVWLYSGSRYAVRNDAGGTAAVLHKATTAGWVAQDLGRSLPFTSGGVYVTAEGNIITGATSGATAVVRRVIVTSGSFAAGTAAGRMIVNGQVGNFVAENLNVGANLNVSTVAANSTAITLLPNGHFEFENHNFYGASNFNRMYFCDGVNKAHEYDGTIAVPIVTGMTVDTPKHLTVHKQHLFLAFPGGSVQHSGIGDPITFTPVLGAAEIGVGHELTGFIPSMAGELVIFTRTTISILYGSSASDWNLVPINEDAGAIEWTAARIGLPHYVDDGGLRSLATTQAFGDFKVGIVSLLVDPLFVAYRAGSITPVASMLVRRKNQYRLFFSDGTGLTFYFGKKEPQVTRFDYALRAYAVATAEETDGSEVLLFGSTDGYVYQLDSGTSFDGDPIDYSFRLAFNHSGQPFRIKQYDMVSITATAPQATTLLLSADFSNGDPDQPPIDQQEQTLSGGGAFWGEGIWNQFFWSSQVHGNAYCEVDGEGTNISVAISGTATYEEPHTVQSIVLHYKDRGLLK